MTLPSSRITKSTPKSNYKPQKPTRSSNASPPSTPLLPLPIFLSNIFFDLLVQDQDDISELTYTRNWSRNLQETGNGQPLTFTTFHTLIQQTRATISNRQLVSQSFVVQPSPNDNDGRTGTVGHIVQLSGLRDGQEVEVHIVSVVQIGWDGDRGRRNVAMESFVLEVS